MVFKFSYPLLLLLIPAAAVFVTLTSRNIVRYAKWKRRTIISLRIVVFALLILCIAGLGIKKVSDKTTSIFLYDGSDSTLREKTAAEEFIADAIKNKKPNDKVGIVNFGQNASVELSPTEKPGFSGIQTRINGNFTNIEQGLKLASSLISSNDRKRIVLVSDGAENAGDALKQARLLKQQNITLDVLPVKSESGGEVQVKEISVPDALRMNEKFDIIVKIDSTIKTKATLKLYVDRELAAEKNVEIQSGTNNFAFSDTAKKGGLVTYTAVIEPENDTIKKNNTISSFTSVEDVAQILVIQDKDEAASELVKILGSDLKVRVSRPESVPDTTDELQKYDAFIISNVSAEKLSDRFLNNLEVCIKHQGKGLLVTGGENSYAPGGYYKTVLEKVLPVNMDIKPKEEAPNLGLMLVIDKSGSMSEGQYGISKVELAKEAAIRSTEVLRDKDMIGVIAFDAAVQHVVKLQKLDNLKKIQDAIGTIRADGGTQIIPPLEEAYLALKDANTKLKHIILLTDGQAEKTGYDSVIEGINNAGITLSTVAVGREADSQLLEALSIGGGGRFYQTDVFSDIPKIFAKETFLAGKTYLNNRTFTPNLKSYSGVLKDIKAIPPLDGYVGTTPKSTASVVFSSDRDEPILATWQYGLGRTAAWTPDAKGMWTSAWMQWDQSPQFWRNIISWIMQKKAREDYIIKGSMAAGTGSVELTLPPEDRAQGEKVEGVIVSPAGQEQKVSLEPVSPGVYRGAFNGDETGVYITNLSVKSGENVVKTISSGVTVPYSPEYDIIRKNSGDFLEKLAYEGGGRIIKDPGEVFSGEVAPVVSITDMVPILLPMVILLFLFDIALRRLNIPFGKVEAAVQTVTSKGTKFVSVVSKPVVEKVGAIKLKSAKAVMRNHELKKAAQVERPSNKTAKDSSQDTSHISTLLEKKKRRER